MNANTKTLDESEALVLREQLTLKCRHLSAAVASATGETVPEPLLSAPPARNLLGDISTLETHCGILQGKLNAACSGKPATGAKAPQSSPAGSDAKKPVNLTARILAAKGVSTVAELQAKRSMRKGGDD